MCIRDRVEGKSVINVEMEEAVTKLDELVVVGYGVRKKSLLTTAISQVSGEEIAKAQPLRVEQALQGRTPGVQIIPNSGQPGDKLTVRIRGAGTTGDADPLFIVDGMPVGGIDYLNPNDIESVEIMKDAASTAIYGASGCLHQSRQHVDCLLYTSDAADDLPCVDLGGSRIIKKKNQTSCHTTAD